jgi:hypothetical protein
VLVLAFCSSTHAETFGKLFLHANSRDGAAVVDRKANFRLLQSHAQQWPTSARSANAIHLTVCYRLKQNFAIIWITSGVESRQHAGAVLKQTSSPGTGHHLLNKDSRQRNTKESQKSSKCLISRRMLKGNCMVEHMLDQSNVLCHRTQHVMLCLGC